MRRISRRKTCCADLTQSEHQQLADPRNQLPQVELLVHQFRNEPQLRSQSRDHTLLNRSNLQRTYWNAKTTTRCLAWLRQPPMRNLNRRTRRSVWKYTRIRTLPPMLTRHLKRSTRQWGVSQIKPSADSTIRLAILIHLSKESLVVEVQLMPMAITLDADTFTTWAKMTSFHQRNFSTICSLASRQEAETCELSSKDHSGSIVIKLRRMTLATYSGSSRLCCFSSSLHCVQAF